MENPIKKEIGSRFRLFRDELGKTQTRLSKELNIFQSTITNIESGKTFPNIKYLLYLFKTYGLNTHWILTGTGKMFEDGELSACESSAQLEKQQSKSSEEGSDCEELLELMKIPLVEQLILARLAEIKVFARTEIEEFKAKEKNLSLFFEC